MEKFIFLNFLVGLFLLPIFANAGELNTYSSTSRLESAVGKLGGLFERYYKFTVFVENGKLSNIVYQDLEHFDLHYQYLQNTSQFKGLSRDQIDELTYQSSGKRKAYTGVLTLRSGDDAIKRSRFSLAMQDTPSAKNVIEISKLIRQSGSDQDFGTALEFEALPHQELAFASQIPEITKAGIGIYASADDPFRISYTEAWNFGKLEIVNDQAELDSKLKAGKITSETILYAREALRDLPHVAGLISAVKLTPASHAVLLSQMYGTPVVYIKNAEELLRNKSGQTVFLNAIGDPQVPLALRWAEIVFNPDVADLKVLQELNRTSDLPFPFDPKPVEIRRVETLTRDDIGAYGGKASQAGALLRRIPKNSIGIAFAIPASLSVQFFNTALASNGQTLRKFIDEKLSSLGDGPISDILADQVTGLIREEIMKAKFKKGSLTELQALLDRSFTGTSEKLRIRSSSNVEDGKEFNGAGLYDSVGFWLRGKKKDDLEAKLKELFASLYNKRAYLARRKFRVEEAKVAMGGLIHRAFRNEVGNGVVRLTSQANGAAKFEIVTLPGENEQVTHALNEVSAEVVSGNTDNLVVEQPYRGQSKVTTLFPKEVYLEITQLMSAVSEEYTVAGQGIDLESEFKILPREDGKYDVRIKQIRPVPHPLKGRSQDGSQYLIFGGKVKMAKSASINDPNAFADLWMPTNIEFELESFTESQLLKKQVQIRSLTYTQFGRTVRIDRPPVKVTVETEEHSFFNIRVDLKNPYLPSLSLEIGGSLTGNLTSRSIISPNFSFSTFVETSNIKIFKNLNNSPFRGYYKVEGLEERVVTRGKSTGQLVIISGTKAQGRVSIVSKDTHFFGEGDNRLMQIGDAQIDGVWSRSLKIPSSSIGYGANHHEGAESFVFDLFGDSSLSDIERKDLDSKSGRYLYLTSSSMTVNEDSDGAVTGPEIVSISENGKLKKLGTWKQRQIKGVSCSQVF